MIGVGKNGKENSWLFKTRATFSVLFWVKMRKKQYRSRAGILKKESYRGQKVATGGEKRKNIWYSENNGIRIRITG